MNEAKEMPNEIKELIEMLKEKKYQFILLKKDKIISLKKSTLCDRITKLLEELYE